MRIRELEDRHTAGTYQKRPLVLTRGKGVRIWDEDDREYIDFTSGIGVAALGHAHSEVVEVPPDLFPVGAEVVRAPEPDVLECNVEHAL